MIRWLKCLFGGIKFRRLTTSDSISTDWDVALAAEAREPEPESGRVEYRFLGVTGEEDA